MSGGGAVFFPNEGPPRTDTGLTAHVRRVGWLRWEWWLTDGTGQGEVGLAFHTEEALAEHGCRLTEERAAEAARQAAVRRWSKSDEPVAKTSFRVWA